MTRDGFSVTTSRVGKMPAFMGKVDLRRWHLPAFTDIAGFYCFLVLAQN